MPEVNVNNYPTASAPQQEPTPTSSSSKLPWIILVVVVVVLVVLGIVFRSKLFPTNKSASTSMTNSQTYQAVFLSNGQVYFGKLADADKDYVTLTDIYYLQVVQPPLQGTSQDQQSQQSQQSQISLVKLGNELHGPMDLMHINKSQILFYEDLKNDGKVVQAIMNYKANPGGSSTTTTK